MMSGTDNFDNDAIKLVPISKYDTNNDDTPLLKEKRKPSCNWGTIDIYLIPIGADKIRIASIIQQHLGSEPMSPNLLPLISKIYDFNPDFPGFDDWLVDVESYKKIIGFYEKLKEKSKLKETSKLEHGYTTDYGGLNKFKNTRYPNKLHLMTDAFSLDHYNEFGKFIHKVIFSS